MTQCPLLVSGGSGQLAHLVLEHLLEKKPRPVIALTRTPSKLAALAARGVEVRFADFDQPKDLARAFAGAKRMLLVSTNSFSKGQRLAQHRSAIEAATLAGVDHIVYTSFVDLSVTDLEFLSTDHLATEKLLAESSSGYTVLRNSFYADILLPVLDRAASSGIISTAAQDGRVAYITREDCALAAATALASPFEGRRVLEITGPAAINSADLAQIAGEVTGTRFRVNNLPLDKWHDFLVGSGVPPPMAKLLTSIEHGISRGALNIQSDAFRDLTGRPAASMAHFIAQKRSSASSGTEA